MLSNEERKQAIDWYSNSNYDLSTIAQHFNISKDELIKQLRKLS